MMAIILVAEFEHTLSAGLTNTMEVSPSSESISYAATQELSNIL
jgi:hypothetical protein